MAFDFPSSPTVGQVYSGYVWDGEKWQVQGAATAGAVRYDIAQGLTPNQQAQARSNTGVTKKNYIINGAMMVSQENGSTASTASGYYAADQFSITNSAGGTMQTGQVASRSPAGSPNRYRATVTVADAAVAAGDFVGVFQNMEGARMADLVFGTAAAKAFILQFGVRAPAGTYSISFRNGAATRTYIAEYVIAAGEANTDVVKSVIVPGELTGAWDTTNLLAMSIGWMLMTGATYHQAAGAWQNANALGSPNQFNFFGTNGNVFELFDVGLYEGAVAPPFQVPDYHSELILCMRYLERGNQRLTYYSGAGIAGINTAYDTVSFLVPKRAVPTMTVIPGGTFQYYNTADGFVSFTPSFSASVYSVSYSVTSATNWKAFTNVGSWQANARL
jgi:hypothetical protein